MSHTNNSIPTRIPRTHSCAHNKLRLLGMLKLHICVQQAARAGKQVLSSLDLAGFNQRDFASRPLVVNDEHTRDGVFLIKLQEEREESTLVRGARTHGWIEEVKRLYYSTLVCLGVPGREDTTGITDGLRHCRQFLMLSVMHFLVGCTYL